MRNGIAVEESIWERPRASAVFKAHVKISEGIDVDKAVEQYQGRRAHRRVELVRHLASIPNPVGRADLSKRFGNHVVRAVIDDGVAELMQVRFERDPLADYAVQDAISHELTPEQLDAVDAISASVSQPEVSGKGERFLLFGVTGSGKTEVYLRAVEACITEGKRAIIMVPEIAMTPQTLQRFASRFPGQIALQHSGLTMGQRFDQWHQIENGRYNVVIGSRSSIFAPVENLGLVVIDEEHEWTFKQSDRAPRYHARDVAEKLCELSGAALVLGSATPDIGTYQRSTAPNVSDPITLLQLPRRINEALNIAPRIGATDIETSGYAESRVVDMREEIQSGHREMISRPLLEALSNNVDRGEKSILFINRRGSASFVQCLSCGTIRTCPNCETPLTLHRNPRQGRGSRLQCHYCSYSVGALRQCRNCDGTGVARRAAGTEGVEEAVRGFFPNTPILRWDSDTARNSAEHAKLLDEFQSHGNHILIGTQMGRQGIGYSYCIAGRSYRRRHRISNPQFQVGRADVSDTLPSHR